MIRALKSPASRCRGIPFTLTKKPDGTRGSGQPQSLHVAQAHVDNCSHRVKMPAEMQRWFSLLRVSALSLGGVRIGDQFISDETWVLPLLTMLRMGFSWSLYFAPSAHVTLLEEQVQMAREDRITDFKCGGTLRAGRCSIGNAWITSLPWAGTPRAVSASKEEVRDTMGKRGLIMRKREDAGRDMTELLAHAMRAVAGTVSVTPARAWRLRGACCARLAGETVWDRSGSAVVGTCGLLFLRSKVSTFSFGASSAFVHVHVGRHLCGSSSDRAPERGTVAALGLRRSTTFPSRRVWCVDAALTVRHAFRMATPFSGRGWSARGTCPKGFSIHLSGVMSTPVASTTPTSPPF